MKPITPQLLKSIWMTKPSMRITNDAALFITFPVHIDDSNDHSYSKLKIALFEQPL